MAAWSLCPFMYHLVSRSRQGAIWCRRQKKNLEHTLLDALMRDTATTDSNIIGTPICAQRRRPSATKVARGSGNSIKSNFGWVVVGRWFRCRATFSDTCKLRCCSTTQQPPPLVFKMNGAWPEHVEWTAWCRTWGKTWLWWNVRNRRKYGVWREVLFRASKSSHKSPATTHRGKKVTWGHGGPFPFVLAPGGLLATHLVAPCSGRKVVLECWSFTRISCFTLKNNFGENKKIIQLFFTVSYEMCRIFRPKVGPSHIIAVLEPPEHGDHEYVKTSLGPAVCKISINLHGPLRRRTL